MVNTNAFILSEIILLFSCSLSLSLSGVGNVRTKRHDAALNKRRRKRAFGTASTPYMTLYSYRKAVPLSRNENGHERPSHIWPTSED
jgi:hypothetical protein